MAQKLSELLAELSGKAKQLEDQFARTKDESTEQLQQWEAHLKERTRAEKAAFEQKKESLDDAARTGWETIKGYFEDNASKAKANFRQARYELKASGAEQRAEWAEEDAEMSIYVALDAIAEAEQAVIDAVKARNEANAF